MAASVCCERWCVRLWDLVEPQDGSTARRDPGSPGVFQAQEIAKNNLLGLFLQRSDQTPSGIIRSFLRDRDIRNLVGVHRALLEAEENEAFQRASQLISPKWSIIRRYRKISHLGQQRWERIQAYFSKATAFMCDGRIDRGAQMTDDEVVALVEHVSQLTNICFFACPQITGNAVLAIAEHCLKLEEIVVSKCGSIEDAAVIELVKQHPNLKKIELRASHITDVALKAIATNCQQLKWIDLSNCQSITSIGVEELLKSCQMLQHIDLRDCHLTIEVPILKNPYSALPVYWR